MSSRAYNEYMRDMNSLSMSNQHPPSIRDASKDMMKHIDEMDRYNDRYQSGRDKQDEYLDVEEDIDDDELDLIGRLERGKKGATKQKQKPQKKNMNHIDRDDHEGWDDYVDELSKGNQQDSLEDGGAHPFAPKISMKSREIWEKNNMEPIHLRYKDELRKKDKNLNDLKTLTMKERKEKEMKEGEMAGKGLPDPKKSKSKKKSSKERQPIYESGMQWIRDKNNKIVYQQAERLENEVDAYDFKPVINRDSVYYSNVSKSFEKRQKQYDDEKKKNRTDLDSRVYGKYKFKPLLNDKSSELAQKQRVKIQIMEKSAALGLQSAFMDKDNEDLERTVFEGFRSTGKSSGPGGNSRAFTETNVSEFEFTNRSPRDTNRNNYREEKLASGPSTLRNNDRERGLKKLQGHTTLNNDIPLKSPSKKTVKTINSSSKKGKMIKKLPEDSSKPTSRSPVTKSPISIVKEKRPSIRSKQGSVKSVVKKSPSDLRASLSPVQFASSSSRPKKTASSYKHV